MDLFSPMLYIATLDTKKHMDLDILTKQHNTMLRFQRDTTDILFNRSLSDANVIVSNQFLLGEHLNHIHYTSMILMVYLFLVTWLLVHVYDKIEAVLKELEENGINFVEELV